MSKFCDLNANIKHIGEVSTSRADGSPSGANILTSKNGVTGEVRDTLGGKLAKMDQQFQDRFNTLAPIPWTPNTLIKENQSLQVFEHDGLFYLPNVKKLPFTTGAVLNTDNWVLSELMTQMKHWLDVGDIRGYGAKCDGVTDDTDAYIAARNAGMLVVFPAGTTTLVKELELVDGSCVIADGATIRCTENFYKLTGKITNGFVRGGKYLCASSIPSTFFDSTGATGSGNGTTIFSVSDINCSSVLNALMLNNTRDVLFDNVRIDCVNGVIYKNKSAEVVITNSIFSNAEWAGRPNTGVGLQCIDGGDGYPEGLTLKDTLFYRFKKPLDIQDLFIGKFTANYFDGIGSDRSTIAANTKGKLEGLTFTGNWWYESGVVWGDGTAVSPVNVRSTMNDHFNFMKPGVDVGVKKFIHGLRCNSCNHDSSQTGVHTGYLFEGNNDNCKISNPSFEGYDSYVQMKQNGQNNYIGDIVNTDNLSEPLYLEYPVNVSNVEGYYINTEVDITGGTYASGAEIVRKTTTFTSGTVNVSIELSQITATSEGFLSLKFYEVGTTTTVDEIVIGNLASLSRYSATETSVRMTVAATAKKPVKCDVVLTNLTGYQSITTTGFADGVIIWQ